MSLRTSRPFEKPDDEVADEGEADDTGGDLKAVGMEIGRGSSAGSLSRS